MPNPNKKTPQQEAYEAHWELTVRGSVHPNDWAAVKKHDDLAPELPEPEVKVEPHDPVKSHMESVKPSKEA